MTKKHESVAEDRDEDGAINLKKMQENAAKKSLKELFDQLYSGTELEYLCPKCRFTLNEIKKRVLKE